MREPGYFTSDIEIEFNMTLKERVDDLIRRFPIKELNEGADE